MPRKEHIRDYENAMWSDHQILMRALVRVLRKKRPGPWEQKYEREQLKVKAEKQNDPII